jgi:hypothetical protein
MKSFVIGNGEELLQIDFEMLEEISLAANFNGIFFLTSDRNGNRSRIRTSYFLNYLKLRPNRTRENTFLYIAFNTNI